MSAAILTNSEIAHIMEMHTEMGDQPGFWDAVSEAYGKSKKQLRDAVQNAKRTGMYKREKSMSSKNEMTCDTTGRPMRECDTKFINAGEQQPSLYEPSLVSVAQECNQCGMVRYVTREV